MLVNAASKKSLVADRFKPLDELRGDQGGQHRKSGTALVKP